MKPVTDEYGLHEAECAMVVSDQPTMHHKKGPRTLADTFIPACLDDAGLKPREFRVLCRVARCDGAEGCFQSLDTMAKGCGMHRQSIQAALKLLVKKGFIQREKRAGKTCVYRVAKVAPIRKTLLGTHTKNLATMVPSGRVPSLKETGVYASLQRLSSFSNASKKPDSIAEVMIHALTRAGAQTSQAAKWSEQFDFHADVCSITARGILDAMSDDGVVESLQYAFRFCHYNNSLGWPLEKSWQAAFDGFVTTCDEGSFGQGPADVPLDWIPHIAGVDGWPEDESETIPF